MKKLYLTEENHTIFALYQGKRYSIENYNALIQWLVDNHSYYLERYCENPQSGPLTQVWHQNGQSVCLVEVYVCAWKKNQEKQRLKGNRHKPYYNDGRYLHYLKEAIFFKEEGEMAVRKKTFSRPCRYDDPHYRHSEKSWKKHRQHQWK
jgi:hypothetical protein